MFKVPENLIGKFIKVHFGPEFNFAGNLRVINKETNSLELFNSTGNAMIYVDIAQIVGITVVKERETVPPSPHYTTQYESPYYEQPGYATSVNTRLSNSTYRRNHAQS